MNCTLKLINTQFLIIFILFASCTKNAYQSQKTIKDPILNEHIDNSEVSSNDSIIIYQIEMDTMLFKRKYLRLHMYKTLKFFNGQDLIGYAFCDSKLECDTTSFEPIIDGRSIKYQNEGVTGQIRKENSHWMHPPRSEYFRILEMNAFPYFVKNKKEWEYELNFGEHWGDEKWITWVGRRTSYSDYKLNGTTFYEFGSQKLDCFEILATTKIPDLGKTESTFYYNEKYGFVYMRFKTINNEIIELKMI